MKKIGLLFFVIMSLFSLTGCGDDTPDEPVDPSGPVEPTPDAGYFLSCQYQVRILSLY